MYDANSVPSVSVPDDKQSRLGRKTDGYETLLTFRVIGVIKGSGQRIVENGDCFIKRDPMLLEISFGLFRIPFE
jgi:hypothetical protein